MPESAKKKRPPGGGHHARSDAIEGGAPVLLLQMPFGHLLWPSIGLSLLRAGLERRSIPARVLYLGFPFAARCGAGFYQRIAEGHRPANTMLAGEWVFAGALFGAKAPPWKLYREQILDGERPAGSAPLGRAFHTALLRARRLAPAFLDRWARRIVAAEPRVVGFSSVFQQHVASLALAQRIKALRPDILIVLGGANVEGAMGEETLASFPFVDLVVSGEADLVFPELVEKALAGSRPRGLVTGLPVKDLDALPELDYRDFMARFAASRLSRSWQPGVFIETSRGCWWGERSHCTFCGLNGATMSYRSKSEARALAELEALSDAWPASPVAVVDNILDLGYFDQFLPALARRDRKIDLFYETKSNLRKDQVRVLRAAGVRSLQPGIESLSDEVLALMRKGVSALANIQLLKWCAELGLDPQWNFLWGFAGESPAAYAAMAELVPLLSHLRPPVAAGPLRLDRFSPNFRDAEAMGYIDVEPVPAYRHVYPLPPARLAQLAYYFRHDQREPKERRADPSALARTIAAWRRWHAHSALFSVELDGRLLVVDLRPRGRRLLHLLEDTERAALLAIDAAAGLDAVTAALPQPLRAGTAPALARLVEQGLAVSNRGRYLGLVLPLGEFQPGRKAIARFLRLAESVGERRGRELRISLADGDAHPHPRRGHATGQLPRALAPADFSLGSGSELRVQLR